jgi:two-component system sensor kinase FixL
LSTIDDDADLAEIVHDLSQPLTALTNYLAAMQVAIDHGDSCKTIANLLGSAVYETARARALVDRLHDALAR